MRWYWKECHDNSKVKHVASFSVALLSEFHPRHLISLSVSLLRLLPEGPSPFEFALTSLFPFAPVRIETMASSMTRFPEQMKNFLVVKLLLHVVLVVETLDLDPLTASDFPRPPVDW